MMTDEDCNKTVLVVEDMAEISENLNARLTSKGYRVLNAIDAESAIKIAEQSLPSLILTDLDLPSLGQMMEQLRAHEALKHMLVAVIDINHPQDARSDIKILDSFDELDALLSTQSQRGIAY